MSEEIDYREDHDPYFSPFVMPDGGLYIPLGGPGYTQFALIDGLKGYLFFAEPFYTGELVELAPHG